MTTTTMNQSFDNPLESRKYLPWLLVLFVGSGCAALIYEIVWLQMLSLVIGSSGISLGVLLGTFMGGMCLGSLVLPRLIPKGIHPLKVYAWLEIGIAIFGIAILFYIQPITEAYVHYGTHAPWVRAAVAAICLLPPTLLMGATLPAIARWVETTPQGVSWMGFFYGGNIVGAVVGCLTAGFYLLRLFDMHIATYVAVVLNLLVAGFAFLLAARTPNVIPSSDSDSTDELDGVDSASGGGAAYFIIALSGMCALGAEVVWTRLLSLMLGQTVYTFSIILAVFLVGLGIGSSVGASAAKSSKHPRAALGWCQLLVAFSVAWAMFVITRSLPFWPVDPGMNLGAESNSMRPWLQWQLDIVRVAWAVLPGSILWGASFPLALASVARRGKDAGRIVGGVYAANTLGAIAGALLFSMLVIPKLGTPIAQQIIIASAAVSALLALLPYIWPGGAESHIAPIDEHGAVQAPLFSVPSLVLVVLSLGLVGVCIASVIPIPWVAVGFGRNSATWLSQSDLKIHSEEGATPSGAFDRICTYVGEGMNVSVAVTKSSAGWQYFHGAGKVQASSDPQDMRLQRMLGHLSVLAHKNPDEVKDVLVVACGAGVTAGSFVPYPFLKNITICDIEPLVPTTVTPRFSKQNYGITDNITVDKRIKEMDGKTIEVAFDDGRHFIRTLPKEKMFDVITSDPIDPWVKGCAALNTKEYYQMSKDHLKPGGIMSLWIPLYESDEATAKSVLATFFEVFPNGIVWSNDAPGGGGYDAVLFGWKDDTQVNLDNLAQLLDRPEYAKVKDSLMEVEFGKGGTGADVAVSLLSTYAGRAADLKDWGKDAQINTDKNLRLQYLAGMAFNSDEATPILNGILKHYRFPDQLLVGSEDKVRQMKDALRGAGRNRFASSAADASAVAAK